MYLVTEAGGAYVCSRHFTSEDYILGCSDSRLNPGAVPSLSSSEKESLFTSDRTKQSLPSLASRRLYSQTSSSSFLHASRKQKTLTFDKTLQMKFVILNALKDNMVRQLMLYEPGMFGATITVGWLVLLSRCLLTVCATTSLCGWSLIMWTIATVSVMDNKRDWNDWKPRGMAGYLCVLPVSLCVSICDFWVLIAAMAQM